MSPFRLISNTVRISVFLVHSLLYWPALVLGSKLTGYLAFAGGMIASAQTKQALSFYLPLVIWGSFRLILKQLGRPSPLVLFQGPAPPPAPPPIATAAKGQRDDPDEVTVIGRLDPKLRELLRQKGTAS